MQYLSQRLAAKSTRTREDDRSSGPLASSQRERILTAAERLIAELGGAKTSIEAIVELAGVSSVTFYEHFGGKEECFLAAYDRAVAEARAQLAAAAPAELPWPDQARAGVHALLAMIAADPARARLCLVEAQKGGPALRVRYETTLDGAVAKLREGRALAAGALPDTLEEATVGGIAWLLRERLELGGGEDVEELLPRITEMVLSPYMESSEVAGDG